MGWAIINYLFIIIAQKLCGTCTISLQIKKVSAGYLVVSVSKFYNVQPSGCYMYIAAMFGIQVFTISPLSSEACFITFLLLL